MRTVLTANQDFYLDPNGLDANDGLTALTPWKTLQHVWNTLRDGYDLAGYQVTVHMADGYYDTGLAAYGALQGGQGAGSLVFTATQTYPPQVLVAPTSGSPFVAAYGAAYSLRNIDVDASISKADCINIGMGGVVWIAGPNDNFFFRNASRDPQFVGNHVTVAFGGQFVVNGNYNIRGSAQCHIQAGDGGRVYFNTNGLPNLIFVNLRDANCVFDAAFLDALNGGSINVAAISWGYVGGATASGKRYLARTNGIIYTEGGGASYLPGNQAGVVQTGGQYL